MILLAAAMLNVRMQSILCYYSEYSTYWTIYKPFYVVSSAQLTRRVLLSPDLASQPLDMNLLLEVRVVGFAPAVRRGVLIPGATERPTLDLILLALPGSQYTNLENERHKHFDPWRDLRRIILTT